IRLALQCARLLNSDHCKQDATSCTADCRADRNPIPSQTGNQRDLGAQYSERCETHGIDQSLGARKAFGLDERRGQYSCHDDSKRQDREDHVKKRRVTKYEKWLALVADENVTQYATTQRWKQSEQEGSP